MTSMLLWKSSASAFSSSELLSSHELLLDRHFTLRRLSMTTPDSKPHVFRWGIAIALLPAVCCLALNEIRADDLPWHEVRYMEALSERGLNDLARIYATGQRDAAQAPELKAQWQLKLCRIGRQQIWFSEAADGTELLKRNLKQLMAIEGIQDPIMKLEVLLESSRMVLVDSQVALTNAETTHLRHTVDSLVTGSSQRVKLLNDETQRLKEAYRTAGGRNSAFNQQQRSDVLNRLRLLIADLLGQKCHWLALTDSADKQTVVDEVDRELEALFRASRNDDTRETIRILLADLAARHPDNRRTGNRSRFQLKWSSLMHKQSVETSLERVEVQVRNLLKNADAKTASTHLVKFRPGNRMEAHKLLWLKSEVCLANADVANRLNDRKLIDAARLEARKLKDELGTAGSGVYPNATRKCLATTALVLQLGSELTEILAQIDVERKQKNNSKALSLIHLALKRLPQDQLHPAVPYLWLRATELYIAESKWDDAVEFGQLAERSFRTSEQRKEAASADLLKCFALGQQINNSSAHRDHYLQALKRHTQTYPDLPGASSATKWLMRLTSATQPQISIDAMLTRMANTTSEPELEQLAISLEQTFWVLLTSADTSHDGQFRSWLERLREIESKRDGDPKRHALHRSTEFPMTSRIAIRLVTEPATLASLAEFEQLLKPESSGSDTSASATVNADFQKQILQFVISARTATSVASLDEQRKKLEQLPALQQKKALCFLARVLRPEGQRTDSLSGNIVLARTMDLMFVGQLKAAKRPAKVAQQFLPLIAATAAMTGDPQTLQEAFRAVSPDQLSSTQLKELSPVLGQLSGTSSMSPQLKDVLVSFWKRMISSQKEGSDLWLESLVQLGILTVNSAPSESFQKQFKLADVLYPNWGNAERKMKAVQIIKQMEQSGRQSSQKESR